MSVKYVPGTLCKQCDRVIPLNLGGPGRNRTTDTRIFKYPPIDRFRFDFNWLTPPETFRAQKT